MVDTSVVVVVFIEASCSRTIAVFIGNTVVVVVEWVLVCKIECADCSVSPWVNSGRDDKAVGRYISRIESLCFKSIIIDWAFEDTVVVVIPVIDIEDAIVVVVKWVCTVTSVESFDEIVNSIVVVIKIVEVTDSIVVVIVSVGFFNKEVVGCHDGLNSG